MSHLVSNVRKNLGLRTRVVPPPPEGCPTTAIIARGRKGTAREQELLTAEQIAEGVKRKKVSGIYRRGV